MKNELDIMIKEYKQLKNICESSIIYLNESIDSLDEEVLIYERIISDLEKLKKVSKK